MAMTAFLESFLMKLFGIASGPGDLLFSSLLIALVISSIVMGLLRGEFGSMSS